MARSCLFLGVESCGECGLARLLLLRRLLARSPLLLQLLVPGDTPVILMASLLSLGIGANKVEKKRVIAVLIRVHLILIFRRKKKEKKKKKREQRKLGGREGGKDKN